jgi:multimeric flavodoxin WrbA
LSKKQVLIVYYSFSSQTYRLVQQLAAGLEESGVSVCLERLEPSVKMDLPFTSSWSMFKTMVTSYFRYRTPVLAPSYPQKVEWDLVVLGGPTWSFFPSGPVLYYLDAFGSDTLKNRDVIPLISCRTYWRMHYNCLKVMIGECRGRIQDPIVFKHSGTEPWKTIGLCLKLLGRLPRGEESWFRKKYPRYGHAPEQYERAMQKGRELGERLVSLT